MRLPYCSFSNRQVWEENLAGVRLTRAESTSFFKVDSAARRVLVSPVSVLYRDSDVVPSRRIVRRISWCELDCQLI